MPQHYDSIIVKLFSRFFIPILFLLPSFPLSAQHQVHGLIIDTESLEPMLFVNIAVVGTTYGTVSNQNGEFTISLDKINQHDSIAFYYLGYETILLNIDDLKDGMTLLMKEKHFSLRGISIVANPPKPEQLIRMALERKSENYPVIAQKREVFTRSNRASYIRSFDLSLKKSDIPEVDKKLLKEMVDNIPRYTRSYEDHLYALHSLPADSAKLKSKVVGIKKVVLREDDGGELDQIEKILNDLFVHKKDENTFWKYRTGPVTFKEKNVRVSTSTPDSATIAKQKADSLYLRNITSLYSLEGDLGWNWDFIQKTNRYQYENQGIIGIRDEDAYAIRFAGKAGGNYQGMIYISLETYAILRIEYSIKERRKEKGFDLLGISYSEGKDNGLVLFERDDLGYYLKYSMKSSETSYGVERPIEIIRKEKRPVFNKKMNEVDVRINLHGLRESTNETLVVQRKGSTENEFNKIKERGVKPERITSYSESIWQGYSIIEPTKQMRDYQIKIKKY